MVYRNTFYWRSSLVPYPQSLHRLPTKYPLLEVLGGGRGESRTDFSETQTPEKMPAGQREPRISRSAWPCEAVGMEKMQNCPLENNIPAVTYLQYPAIESNLRYRDIPANKVLSAAALGRT